MLINVKGYASKYIKTLKVKPNAEEGTQVNISDTIDVNVNQGK